MKIESLLLDVEKYHSLNLTGSVKWIKHDYISKPIPRRALSSSPHFELKGLVYDLRDDLWKLKVENLNMVEISIRSKLGIFE